MATWPATGDTDWNTKMLAYLAIEHDTDGTHSVHDAEGGYASVDVDAVKTTVYTKYLTGNLDADGSTNVAHGLTVGNILHVSVICYEDNTSTYTVATANAGTAWWSVNYDATNIIIGNVNVLCQGNAYRIKIDYTV